MERKNLIIFIAVLLAVACVSALCTAAIVTNDVNKRIHDAVEAEKSYYGNLTSDLDTLLEIKKLVDNNFVDGIVYENVDEALAEKFVEALGDKYSEYLTKDELKSYLNKVSGSFVGIGVTCVSKNGKIYIDSVIENSPAEEAGIKGGESIVAVGDITVTEETYDDAVNAVAGEKGTFVTLKIEDADGKIRTVKVERREVVTKTVHSEMLEGNIAYIRITQFASNTADAFLKAVDTAINNGAKGFLFDVRDNSGGSLDSVVAILDRILPKGPIVNIVYGSGKNETIFSDEKCIELPMAVLVNGKTASAAELFASALRDYKIAELYGVKTYGKGYMQSIITLNDGSGLRLSVAKYNPPYGENYEGVGVAPHVLVEDDAKTETDEQFESAKKYFINK
ncbi:MAG: S41 family peptidase [Ruminococcaceae bacterium]|nr:S41 family peptidase [Oscillospiraceae bacterium]